MDAQPWSPEVLDALSLGFVNHGYDIDWLITTILTSKAYNAPVAACNRSGCLRFQRSRTEEDDGRAVHRFGVGNYRRVARSDEYEIRARRLCSRLEIQSVEPERCTRSADARPCRYRTDQRSNDTADAGTRERADSGRVTA